MSSDARIKRPTLERTQPIRQWSTLFEAAGSSASPSDPAQGAEPRREGGSALGDVVSRSVDLGYRVVDEYLRRGQAAAKRVGERSYDVQGIRTGSATFPRSVTVASNRGTTEKRLTMSPFSSGAPEGASPSSETSTTREDDFPMR